MPDGTYSLYVVPVYNSDYDNLNGILSAQGSTLPYQFPVDGVVQNNTLQLSAVSIRGISESVTVDQFIVFDPNTIDQRCVQYIDTTAPVQIPINLQNKRLSLSFSNGPKKQVEFVDSNTYQFQPVYQIAQDVTQPQYTSVARPTVDIPKTQRKIQKQQEVIYSDISLKQKAHPLTGDVIRVINEASVIQSLKNLIRTDQRELPFGNKIGGGINAALFDLADSLTIDSFKESLLDELRFREPRQTIEDIRFDVDPDKNQMQVTIVYYINSITNRKEFTMFLDRTTG